MLGRLLPRMRHDGARVRVHHAPTFIEMDEKPAEALAAKPEASIAVAADLVARGEGDALVSAGNTGASVLACARRWTLLQGVRRAALAAVYPTELRRGEKDDPFSLILDVGATIDATAEDLVGFAVMGSAYAKLRLAEPPPARRAAVERHRGRQGSARGRRGARRARRDDRAQLHRQHRGPRHPARRRRRRRHARASSATSCSRCSRASRETVVRLARYAHKERLAWRLGLVALSSAIDQLKEVTDWQQYGGAPLLGFTHPFIKAHGRSNARAIQNAIKVAHKALAGNLCGNIARTMAELDERAQRRAEPSRLAMAPRRCSVGCRRCPFASASASACSSRAAAAARAGRAPPRHTFRWDLDKTYLRTEFDSLARSREERDRDRRRQAGVSRARPRCCARCAQDGNRICIVSGSPTQMRQVLAAKLALDGVEYDEFVLKNNLKNILRGRFRALRAQIPYKLPAMLQSRIGAPRRARDAVRRRRRGRRDHLLPLRRPRRRSRSRCRISSACSSRRAPTRTTRAHASISRAACRRRDAVRRMFIHLDRRSPPLGFRRFGPRLVPVFNYFQAALVLYEDQVLTARQVIFVALEMLDSGQYELGHLATSVQDVIRRGRITRETALRLTEEAHEAAQVGRAVRAHRSAAVRADRRVVSRASSRAWRRGRTPSRRPPSRSTTSAWSTRSTSTVTGDARQGMG